MKPLLFCGIRAAAFASLAAVLLPLAAGCATTSLLKFRETIPNATNENPAIKMVTLWDPGEGPGLDHKTSPGFLGHIMFFTAKDKFPVRVNGGLRVYLFDDEGSKEQQIKPVREFYLEPATLAAHFKKSDLGATYGIFIPYPKKVSHKVNCSLKVRYIPCDERTGKPMDMASIYSEMASVALPGPDREQIASGQQAEKEKESLNEKIAAAESRTMKVDTHLQPAASAPEKKPRSAAAALTEAEQRRIIHEARQSLDENLPTLDEEEPAPPAPRSPRRHALAEPLDVEPEPLAAPRPVERTVRPAPVRTGGHPLLDSTPDDAEDEAPARRSFQHRFQERDDRTAIEPVTHHRALQPAAVEPAESPAPFTPSPTIQQRFEQKDDAPIANPSSGLKPYDIRDGVPPAAQALPELESQSPPVVRPVVTPIPSAEIPASRPADVAPPTSIPQVVPTSPVASVTAPSKPDASASTAPAPSAPVSTTPVAVPTAAAPAAAIPLWSDLCTWLSARGMSMNTMMACLALIVLWQSLRRALTACRKMLTVWSKIAKVLQEA